MASRKAVEPVGFRLTVGNLSLAVTIIVLIANALVTWGTFGWRITQVESWQSRHEPLAADMASLKATLEGIQRQLGSIDNTLGRIGERAARNTGEPMQ